jgi:hypothetical protein
MWIGFIWLRMGTVVCSCEHGIEVQGFIKGEEFLDYLGDYLLKKDSVPWN